MKSRYFVFITLLLFLLSSGCAYVDVRGPFDTDLDQTEMGSKIGRAHSYSVLWLFAWGDGSYEAAARNGNIKILRHADYELQQYLFGLYYKRTIIVYGD